MARIVGKKYNDYYSTKNQRQVKGYNVYYTTTVNGTEGVFAGDLWIVEGNELYNKVAAFKVPPNGIECDLVYDNTGRFPSLCDIVIKSA